MQTHFPLNETAMRTVSLWQPWASLIAARLKCYETRSWHTQIRGPVAIHAAARPCIRDIDPELANLLTAEFGETWPEDLPRGAVLCTANLWDCLPTVRIRERISRQEYLCGDWSCGRFAWGLDSIEAFTTPIPARGRQGFWTWKGAPS